MSAKDLGTGTEQKIEIKAGSGLSDQDIDQMVKDAESHAAEDKRQRELAEARNSGDNAAYQAEKQLGELGDKVDAGRASEIEQAIKELREALEGEDVEADQGQDRGAAAGVPRGLGGDVPAGGAGRTAAGRRGDQRRGSDQEEVVDAEVVDEGQVS